MIHPTEPPQPIPTGSDLADRRVGSRGPWLGWLRAGLLLSPVITAIWAVPGFTTQDGPAHLYNAWIIADSFSAESPYRPYYEVRWQPLPNLAGHLALVGLFRVVSPWAADRILMTLTLAGLAASAIWLHWRVVGREAPWATCLLSALVSLNYLWLLGFTSFLLGACLFPITLGAWWPGRDRPGAARLVLLSALLLLGYFCHLVSLGLTALGLVTLALLAPLPGAPGVDWGRRLRRLGRTAACLAPLLPLGLVYLRLSRGGGPMHPEWENLASAYSPSAWAARLGWVDPLSLAMKDMLPFTEQIGRAFTAFSPLVWFAVAVLFWWAGRLGGGVDRDRDRAGTGEVTEGASPTEDANGSRRDREVWLVLAALLVGASVLGPDSLGPGHGEYLPQRLALLGFVALVPAFGLDRRSAWGRLCCACLSVALVLQTVIVWDYALYSDRTAGQIIGARELTGRGKRIATLLHRIGSRFRVNPVLHADCWLGIGTGNIVWSNYETRHYYFPVKFRDGVDRPDSSDLEWLAITGGPGEAESRLGRWEQILSDHADAIDEVVTWRDDPALDAITGREYRLVVERGDVRVFVRRDSPSPAEREKVAGGRMRGMD